MRASCRCWLRCPITNRLSFIDSFAVQYISNKTNMQDPIADKTLDTMRVWLQECDECHSTCSRDLSGGKIADEPELPTRVIQVTGSPRLMQSNGLRGRYVALSHCWG